MSDTNELEIDYIRQEILAKYNLRFLARDLGFADHTAIHDAAIQIIAKHLAKIVYLERLWAEERENMRARIENSIPRISPES